MRQRETQRSALPHIGYQIISSHPVQEEHMRCGTRRSSGQAR
jgi:hypothetical protein